jgi:hypothetical protein
MTTEAPAITAPWASITVPWIVPALDWAKAEPVKANIRPSMKTILFFMFPPDFWLGRSSVS